LAARGGQKWHKIAIENDCHTSINVVENSGLVNAFIKFIYSNDNKVDAFDLSNLIIAAQTYELTEIYTAISTQLIDIDFIVELIKVAWKLQDEKLKTMLTPAIHESSTVLTRNENFQSLVKDGGNLMIWILTCMHL